MASSLGNGGKATQVVSPASIKYISLNTKLAPLDDVHVRRAIAYATDRQGYIDASGGGKPLYTIITPIQLQQIASQADADALVKSLPATTFDLGKAKAEMAQSKYPNGFSTAIHCPDFGIAECQVMAAQLAKIGIKVKASKVATLTYINETQSSSKYPFVYGYIGCTGPDPSGCLGYLLGKDQLNQLNSAQYDPPGMEALIQSGVTATDAAKRFAIYSQILKKIAADVPYITYQLPVYTIMLSNKYEWPGIEEINSDPIFYTPWILNLRAKS
jgi:peptide/nickel transport system substrate-binding protein